MSHRIRGAAIIVLAAIAGFVLVVVTSDDERGDAKDQAGREAQLAVTAAAALYEQMLGQADVELERAAELSLDSLLRALREAPVTDRISIVMTAPDGSTLMGDDGVRPARPVGNGIVVARGEDGVRRVYAVAEAGDPVSAVFYAGVETGVAYANAANRFRFRIVALIVVALLALAIWFALSYLHVSRRVRNLSEVTHKIGDGDLSARSGLHTNDDIGRLGQTIDAMADQLEARERERAHLMAAIVSAGEDERKRIASDVHDDSIQVMSAHVMGLQLLRRRVDDTEMQERIRELEDTGRAATARLRELVFELYSPILEERGIEPALDALLERTFDGTATTFTLAVSLDEEAPDAIRSAAYRIAQEAITNVRAHAEAGSIAVTVTKSGEFLDLRVADDGRGFDADEVEARPGHLGLTAARERCSAVGGTFQIETGPGRGTVITARLPWSL